MFDKPRPDVQNSAAAEDKNPRSLIDNRPLKEREIAKTVGIPKIPVGHILHEVSVMRKRNYGTTSEKSLTQFKRNSKEKWVSESFSDRRRNMDSFVHTRDQGKVETVNFITRKTCSAGGEKCPTSGKEMVTVFLDLQFVIYYTYRLPKKCQTNHRALLFWSIRLIRRRIAEKRPHLTKKKASRRGFS